MNEFQNPCEQCITFVMCRSRFIEFLDQTSDGQARTWKTLHSGYLSILKPKCHLISRYYAVMYSYLSDRDKCNHRSIVANDIRRTFLTHEYMNACLNERQGTIS